MAAADPIELAVSSDFNVGFGFENDLKTSGCSRLILVALLANFFSTLVGCSGFAFALLSYWGMLALLGRFSVETLASCATGWLLLI